MTRPLCETCRWWAYLGTKPRTGECRRYPPPWPKTDYFVWCGEHQPANSAEPTRD